MTPRRRAYLDHNATSPLRPEARTAMLDALDLTGNPSSVHAEGRRARAAIETAREQVAALVGAKPDEVVFTSGGTEANNALLRARWESLIVSGIEHDSVLEPARTCGARLTVVPAHQDGTVDTMALRDLLAKDALRAGRALVSVQAANNETGVLQPIEAVVAIAREHGLTVHTDAVQAAGKVPLDFARLGVDFMTLSAHKIGGPKGAGALILREGTRLEPFLRGGGQERRMRAGTENVAGIAGFGAAAEAALRNLDATAARLSALRNRLEHEVVRLAPGALIVGASAPRLPNTSCIALRGASAETLVIALDLEGVAVSAGAACSSGKVAASHVLAAMGLGADVAGSSIRVSLGWNTTPDDIDAVVRAWDRIADSHRSRRKVA